MNQFLYIYDSKNQNSVEININKILSITKPYKKPGFTVKMNSFIDIHLRVCFALFDQAVAHMQKHNLTYYQLIINY